MLPSNKFPVAALTRNREAFASFGDADMVLHTPAGTSNILNFSALPYAPSVFHSGAAGRHPGAVSPYPFLHRPRAG